MFIVASYNIFIQYNQSKIRNIFCVNRVIRTTFSCEAKSTQGG